MKVTGLTKLLCLVTLSAMSQPETFQTYGLKDKRPIYHAIINATIIIPGSDTIFNGSIIIKDELIQSVGQDTGIPKGAVVLDVHDRFIYPSFIESYSSFGMPPIVKQEKPKGPQYRSGTEGAYSWNQALKPETEAHRIFIFQKDSALKYLKAGFGTAICFQPDGISRGSAAAVTFASEYENQNIIKPSVASCYSFSKGSSTQDYPGSQMGVIALLRQTWYDAEWYSKYGHQDHLDVSLEAWTRNQRLPQYFEVANSLELLRAGRLGREFGIEFMIKGSGDEYKRGSELAGSGNFVVIPVNFPEPYDLTDPYDALNLSLGDLKHWEMAPYNPAILDGLDVKFALTASGLKERSEFIKQVRIAIKHGLEPVTALRACTVNPAGMFGIDNLTGNLKAGLLANFIITSGDIFKDNSIILENWNCGKRFIFTDATDVPANGHYSVSLPDDQTLNISIKGEETGKSEVLIRVDTLEIKAGSKRNHNFLSFSFSDSTILDNGVYSFSGTIRHGDPLRISGFASGPDNNWFEWEAVRDSMISGNTADSIQQTPYLQHSPLTYPNKAYGYSSIPEQEPVLFRNATVWTNEEAGILKGTDVAISEGRIIKVEQNIDTTGYKVIDCTGRHLTCGIIDEHSHIAISKGVNECTQPVTAEVRIGDVLNSDDINIYRQLAGGVTSAQLLHGSCNPIGGQSALIKMRWGSLPEDMKIKGADGFIKFALGENVKQSNWGDSYNSRYPQTRMGVEQLYYDAFHRAREYDLLRNNKDRRRDIELDILVEILKSQRFVSCHSYQQGEINMLMHVADSMGFRINTFTHILEGYKVADKMRLHGVGGSTFSDWWAYKYEVIEAIPFNSALMHRSGVLTAVNSDDAEMARRLNQEAAKAILYGNVSEEEVFKFVTLNPAKLLHLDHRMGSIKEGKDADIVIWSDNPVSIYAKAEYTFVDGRCYYSDEKNEALRARDRQLRTTLLKKMSDAGKNSGKKLKQPTEKKLIEYKCINEEDLK